MDWEKELSGQLTAALAGLTPAPFPPDDRWNSLTFLDLEGAEAGKRWKKLAARALKRAKTFEIHCWSEEPGGRLTGPGIWGEAGDRLGLWGGGDRPGDPGL